MLFEHYMLKPLHENKMISVSEEILEDYKNMHMVAGSAGDKGINPSIINEYRAVHHRVRLNERIKATSTIQDIMISWDIPNDIVRLKELEEQFATCGVSFPILNQKTVEKFS